MLFTGVSLKKAWGFFPYESLTKWLFLYKLSFSWLELEHSVLCSFWGLTFLLIFLIVVPAASRMVWTSWLPLTLPLSSIVLKTTVLASRRAGGDHCVCVIPSQLSALCCFFNSAPSLWFKGECAVDITQTGVCISCAEMKTKILKNVDSWLQRHKG